jgi:multicomponent Na+:H+ antiporter subunit F
MFSEALGIPLALAILTGSLLLLAALALALLRIARGPTAFDRVVALDLIGGICLCVLVMFAIYFDQQVLLDAAFAIALVSFIGTVAFARFLGKGGDE